MLTSYSTVLAITPKIRGNNGVRLDFLIFYHPGIASNGLRKTSKSQ